MPFNLNAVALAVIATCASCAHAADASPSIYTFSGYGTLGTLHSSESKADFTAPAFRPNGAGYSRSWSSDVDSRIAGQLSANFNSDWSAVVQVMVEQQWDNSYRPTLEWANIQYAPTTDFSIRVGRITLATFLVTNSRKVGYTLPWARTPSTFYEVVPISNSDGVDLTYRSRLGNFKNSVTLFTGKKDFKTAVGPFAGQKSSVSRQTGLIDTMEYGAASLQFSRTQSRVQVGPLPESAYKLKAIGANYDPGNWFLTAEWNRSSFFLNGDLTNWYTGGGYRIKDWTPYLLTSERRLTNNPRFTIAPPQRSTAVGLRWDVVKNTDIKLQYDRVSLPPDSSGTLINLQPDYRPGGKFHVVSATVDFVF